VSVQLKNSEIELWIDPKTNKVIDHSKVKDKTKIVRLSSVKRIEVLEREYMIRQ
jgi:hypothetical protein